MNEELLQIVKRLSGVLDRRERRHKKVEPYFEGSCPLPVAITQARMTKAYRYLMPMAEATWGSLIVDSVLDRLEVTGIKETVGDESDRERIENICWGGWQDNQMDAESSLTHTDALIDGRAFAWVWPNDDGEPEITIDTASQMVVEYREGFVGRKPKQALRRWVEDGVPYAKLFRPDGIYKFRGPKDYGWRDGIVWRELTDERLDNDYKVVPVVELAVNRRHKPEEGPCGYARGEFEHCLGLLDRINLLTFLGLVVAVWMGFPLRGVIGEKIIRDDGGNPIAPFDAHADAMGQLENPQAKIFEYSAADRKNLSIYAELDQLAVITKTPRTYFPQEHGTSNVSADTIRASEGGLHAKVGGKHKPSLGEGWEGVMRLIGMMSPDPVVLSQRAQIQWADHESRSLAERADAYSKLQGLPWAAAAELALNANPDQIATWAAERANDPFSILAAAAQRPAEVVTP